MNKTAHPRSWMPQCCYNLINSSSVECMLCACIISLLRSAFWHLASTIFVSMKCCSRPGLRFGVRGGIFLGCPPPSSPRAIFQALAKTSWFAWERSNFQTFRVLHFTSPCVRAHVSSSSVIVQRNPFVALICSWGC